jgi:hypothetical protein
MITLKKSKPSLRSRITTGDIGELLSDPRRALRIGFCKMERVTPESTIYVETEYDQKKFSAIEPMGAVNAFADVLQQMDVYMCHAKQTTGYLNNGHSGHVLTGDLYRPKTI